MFIFFFRIFIFFSNILINISMKPEVAEKNYLYTEGRLNVFTALGHVLMASAQLGWTISVAGVSSRVLPCPIRHQLAATALILPSDTWEYVM